ncbi:MAG: DUF6067 family protein [Ignavibacteriales bacterium]|nr:DUF6067 family protein [Ignavibacteriales bacterium]
MQGQDLRHRPGALQPRSRALRPAQPGPRDLLAGAGRRLFLAPGAPRRRLHRGLVRARAQGRGGHQQRHVALAQLTTSRGSTGSPATSGIDGLYLDDVAFDRTTMKRVRKVLDRNRAGRAHRPPQRQPVQRARRVRLERQPLPRALPLPQPALVRRVLRLQRQRRRLLARRDLGHPLRPDGRDARRTAATRGGAWSSG